MGKVLNQKGATLILVLLLIVIISIFSATLFASVNNSVKQHKQIAENIQQTELVRMGMMKLSSRVEIFLRGIPPEDQKFLTVYDFDLGDTTIALTTKNNKDYNVEIKIDNVSTVDFEVDGTVDFIIKYTSSVDRFSKQGEIYINMRPDNSWVMTGSNI